MYKDLSSKTKLFINMLIAQIGFTSISLVAILSDSQILHIITINVTFALIVYYMNWAATQRIVGGIDRFKNYMDDIMNFISMKSNKIRKAKYMKNDEIGIVLTELNNYVEKLEVIRKADMKVVGEVVLTLDKISKGTYSTKVNSNSDNFMINALKTTVNNMIDNTQNSMNNLKDVLISYSNNDFRDNINIPRDLHDEMLVVMQAINKLGLALNHNAQDNLKNGQALESDSTLMTNASKNVALRANEQAASLEEVASALEEISSITSSNAQNASVMADLGEKVKISVENGQTLANKTSEAMDEINKEVISINESITVIDEIAFQTNILSLNAAVEAATAGESGKGFAVVAQEVRNLANRSSQAAKEIKTLVEYAKVKANNGKKISDKMILGYKELNININKTINIIADVSQASKEQIQGIEQINSSVSSLDRVTQENASEANTVLEISNKTLSLAQNLLLEAKNKKIYIA